MIIASRIHGARVLALVLSIFWNLSSTTAGAATLEADPSDRQVGALRVSEIFVRLSVTDGFTNSSNLVRTPVEFFESPNGCGVCAAGGRVTAEAEVQGTLDPRLAITNISIDLGAYEYEHAIVAPSVTLTPFLKFEYFAMTQQMSNGTPWALLPFNQQVFAGSVGRYLTEGIVVVDGVELLFAVDSDFGGAYAQDFLWFETAINGPKFSTGGAGTVAPAEFPLGTVNGLSYTMQVGFNIGEEVFAVPIPEPSTALLMGLGLATLAARRR